MTVVKLLHQAVEARESNIQGVPKKVSIKNFYSELLKVSIHIFWIYLDSEYL